MKTKTAKIKVTVIREEVKEVEVRFPYYTRDGSLYCKFLSKDTAMWIVDFPFKKQIEYSNWGIPDSWITNDPITEEEFNSKFNEVMNALIEINDEKAI